MVVYTGGSASIKYGYEGTLDSEGMISSSPTFGTKSDTITNIFGINQKVTNLTLNTGRIDLNKIGQIEPTKFAYGQQGGNVSVGFVWDGEESYKIWASLYKTPSGTAAGWVFPAGSSTPFSHSTSPTAPHSLTTQIQVNTSAAVLTRTLRGCIVNSLGISTSVGEVVNGTVDMTFAQESTADVADAGAFVTQTGAGDQIGTPYTFAHGVLQTTTGDGASLATVAEVQDIDITFASNAELLWELGSHYGVSAFRKIFDISGRMRATFNDEKMLQYVIDQSIIGTETETIADDDGVGMTLTFTNGNRSITLEFGGVSFGDHSTTGIEPSEVIFEEINWKCKAARVKVDTTA